MSGIETLADQAARDRAMVDIGHSLAVSAGAGAGKTETLIGRLREALSSGCAADQIVAITFTERAARDLVDKLRSRLPAELVPAIDQMTVGTIHSFCLSILRKHPLEAGLPPVFSTQDELLAGADAARRATRIRQRFFDQIETTDDPQLHQALHAFVETNGIVHFDKLIALIDRQWDRFDAADPPAPLGFDQARQRMLARVRELAADTEVPVKLRQAIADWLPEVERIAVVPTMVEALAAIPKKSPLGGLGGTAWTETRHEINALVEAAGRAVEHDVLARVVGVVMPLVLDEARQRYQAGNVSFDDILVLTRRLLQNHQHVLSSVRRSITHLCVDEFQDTDIVQFDIVAALTAPPADPLEASPVLFAVGDPKQSIYGFRDADVSLFQRVSDMVHVTSLQLDTNFRSRPQILDFVNEVFGAWFDAEAPNGQVAFSPLAAHVPSAPTTILTLGGEIDAPSNEASARQATDIAGVITTAHDAWRCRVEGQLVPARYGDIAVLVRTRADLLHLEPALRRAGIPYVVEGGALLYDTREVRDILRVLAAVNDTASPITMVNALRTSVLAVSDVELLEHRRAGGRWNAFVGDEPVGHAAVLQAYTAMRGWIGCRHRVPVPELIADIAHHSYSLAASMSDGAHVTTWRRLRLVLDEARWWFEQTGGSLGDYLAWIALRIDNEDRSNVTTNETDDDAVHILTVHAAKGLEFPIVVAAGMGRQTPPGDHVRAVFADSQQSRSVAMKVGKLETIDWDNSGQRADDKVEAARLAYVACTRAEDHLVVCLHRPRRGSGTSAAEMSKHLGTFGRTTMDLVQVEPVSVPSVTELDPRVDRPDRRAREWAARSSWSATSLRQRLDDAATSVEMEVFDGEVEAAEAQAEAKAGEAKAGEPNVATSGGPTMTGASEREVAWSVEREVADSVHAKHVRAFASLPDQIGRYGTKVGRAVHGVMQVVELQNPRHGVDALVVQQCRSEDVPDEFHTYVGRLVESIIASDVFARMAAADLIGTVRREMYVGATVDEARDLGVYGIIDAIWMVDGRFVVVDFKTDHVLEPDHVLVERYSVQLQAYEAALHAATGIEVAELLLCVALPDGSPAATITIPLASEGAIASILG